MCIVYEHRHWEGEVYYFRSTMGTTPICKVYRAGEGWEVLFYRGPENLGPYPYDLFERAKNHLYRYLVPREEELMGEPANWGTPGTAERYELPRTADPPMQTTHPRHGSRRGRGPRL